jgi:hypothetical protein
VKETPKLVKWFQLIHLTQFGEATVCLLVTRTNINNTKKKKQIDCMGNTPDFQWYVTLAYVGGDEMTEGFSP